MSTKLNVDPLVLPCAVDGTIDYVVSDHSPCVPSLKNPCTGDFFTAWGGISSLGLGVSLLWTESQRRRSGPAEQQFGIADIICWTAEKTAKRVGLEGSVGKLEVGTDANFAGASSLRWELCPFRCLADTLPLVLLSQSSTLRLDSQFRRCVQLKRESQETTADRSLLAQQDGLLFKNKVSPFEGAALEGRVT